MHSSPLKQQQQQHQVRGRKKDSIEQFISSPQLFLENGLSQLRYMILIEGITTPSGYDQCPYRSYVWSILLRVPNFESQQYVSLLQSIPHNLKSEIYRKIKNDTFRTLKNDNNFKSKVTEDTLIRILSCIAITIDDEVGYVQGLNVLLAPIAYVCHKSEPLAFAILHNLVINHIPLYITPNLDGVHTALHLMEIVLKIIDPVLNEYLDSKFLKPEIYAFPSILTLSACTPPLKSVLKLWDFLFAYGTHMNILFVVAQLIINRSNLLNSEQPMKILRNFPPLNENEIIKLSLSFIPELPKGLYDLIARHGYDKNVPNQLKAFVFEHNL
ncbi:rab-GTPase-TBC domain-containing protein [Scheffersomyces coipomensis]|uniref:rab-GTPase-TBC domain-containing protein n=1 Tax=Scheffersomyces coipomensis TaxID=1788519 RepID=UPI00315CCA3D